jgi:phospholipase A-2-activating protein
VAPKPKGVLPVRTYLSFKQMNIAAAKTKIASLNEEIKATSVSLQTRPLSLLLI